MDAVGSGSIPAPASLTTHVPAPVPVADSAPVAFFHLVKGLPSAVRTFGLSNVLEGIVLTQFGAAWRAIRAVPVLRTWMNRFLISHTIGKMPPRPNALSTWGDYASWESLTDRTYSDRHLPPAPMASFQSLPSADAVAELFQRPAGKMKAGKSSVLFTYFAQWFTDGFLRTDYLDPRKNNSNHDIDLSNLYGLDREASWTLRAKVGGRLASQVLNGEEYPPAFLGGDGQVRPEYAKLRMGQLLAVLQGKVQMPPRADGVDRARLFEGFGEVLGREPIDPLLFAMGGDRINSVVGFVAMNVLFLREHNRICGELERAYPRWDDERLFQTTRNILIGVLTKIVINEYINHITPYQFPFSLDPGGFENHRWYRQNWMAIEFNLLYRWHSLVPDSYVIGGHEYPLAQTFFRNELVVNRGLGGILADATAQQAGQIGLRNTPALLCPVERGGVVLGRYARLRGYNDYRELCRFRRVTSFEQITGDPEIGGRLKDLYGTVDRLEYFPGMFAEDAIAGSVVSYLIGRLVSVDAFSQVMTNPLLSANLFHSETFTREGLKILESTESLSDIVHRNIPAGTGPWRIGLAFKGGGSVSGPGEGVPTGPAGVAVG